MADVDEDGGLAASASKAKHRNGKSNHKGSEKSSSSAKPRKSVLVNRDLCAVCKTAGDLILCDDCPRSYHEECARIAFQALDKRNPEGARKRHKLLSELEEKDAWTCPKCFSPSDHDNIQVASSFPLDVPRERRKALGGGVSIGRLMQYFEIILPVRLFDEVFRVVFDSRSVSTKSNKIINGNGRDKIYLQDAILFRKLEKIIGSSRFLTALEACEENCSLAVGLSTMGGPQPCVNPSCSSGFKKFRVLRTRCFFCGTVALDSNSKLPLGFALDESIPINLRKVNLIMLDSDQTRFSIAARGLDYFSYVALEDKEKQSGDILFLAYKLWSALRGTPLELRAAVVVEELCSRFIDTVQPAFNDESETDDLADILDTLEGMHVIVRILSRSDKEKDQPKIKDQGKARLLMSELQEAMEGELLRFDISDIVGFDPARHCAPYTPVNHCSNCGEQNSKRAALCSTCKHTLQTKFDYGAMTDAVVWCFVFDSTNFKLICQTKGRPCTLAAKDVLRVLPEARKYRELDELGEDFWKLECYFVTHFIYVMSDWGEVALRRELYLEEFQFIASSLSVARQLNDPEIVGEFLHCLAILGYSPERDEATNEAIPYLKKSFEASVRFLAATEAKLGEKGMWTIKSSVRYARYHSAWCGVVGLIPHRFESRTPVAFVEALDEAEPRFSDSKRRRL